MIGSSQTVDSYYIMSGDLELDEKQFLWRKPIDLLQDDGVVKVCAPMVRYSKLAFRMLARKYNCDLAFTPMIIANSFVQSLKARDNEFTTCREDRPLIVQFAAHNSNDFADAAEIVSPYADGVDLNCGCPQRWAMADGYGACLIKKPQLVYDMVRQTRNRVNNPDFTVSVKIRIHDDVRETVELCRRIESAGASWINIHGRTKEQRNQSVNLVAVKLIRENVGIPVIANGDIKSMEDITKVQEVTGVNDMSIPPCVGPPIHLSNFIYNGVMCARGMLQNPAMFDGYDQTPLQCLKDWVSLSLQFGTPHTVFHHHLMYMCERFMSKAERRIFNSLSSTPAVLDYLRNNYGI